MIGELVGAQVGLRCRN